MSKTIDEHVVEMRFDNKEFEKHAKTTMDTLTRLKVALNFTKSTRSLENLAVETKEIKLDGIASGIELLEKRFSTMGIVGMRVIENITDAFMNKLGKAVNFVSDSIVSGGIKRAMNIENAHFQLQALLKDEQKVQAIMDDAMTSVDGTAYAYDEAAKAASQFAASGLESGEKMRNALRGIVGVAAMTNSEYESISQIFTTVAGNNRLMGDQLLQLSSRGLNAASTISDFFNGVQDGSKEASDNVKELIFDLTGGLKVTEGDIREFVSKGKISFDMFSEAMTEAFADSAERANETFTGAFSNMKSAFARIGAEFVSPLIEQNSEIVKLFNAIRVQVNNVKKALTFDKEIGNTNALSKQFTDQVLLIAKAVTNFIQNANITKPMEAFYYGVETIKNGAKGLYSVLAPLGNAFKETFSFSVDDVVNLATKIESITSKMKLSEEGSKNLHDAFKGVFDIISLLGDGLLKLLSSIIPIEKPIGSLGNGLLKLAGDSGRALSEFASWIRQSPSISKAYDIFSNAVKIGSDVLNDFVANVSLFIEKLDILGNIQKIFDGLGKSISIFGKNTKETNNSLNPFTIMLKIMSETIKRIGPIATNVMKGIATAISYLSSAASKMFDGKWTDLLFKMFTTTVFTGLASQISSFVKTLDKTVKSAGGFLANFNKIVKSVTDTFKELQNNLKAKTLKEIAIALALIAGSILALSFVDSEKLSGSLAAISIMLAELTGIFILLNKLDLNKKGAISGLTSLISISASVFILAAALKNISNIDTNKLLSSLGAISVLLLEITGIAIALSKYGGKIKTGAIGIIAFSTAIYILTSSVEKLGTMDVNTLIKGLISVSVLLAELAAFMTGAKFGKFKPSQAISITILASSLLILQNSVKSFGNMNTDNILKGLIAIGGILTEIAAFTLASGESKHLMSTSTSLIMIAAALIILEKPLISFGNMQWEQIGKGLLVMAVALGEIIIAMRLIPKNAVQSSASLLLVAYSLKLIAESILKMSVMSWSELAKGLIALGSSMTILAVSMNAMKGTLGASAAILVMAVALGIFVPSLKALGSMSISQLAIGLLSLAAAFTVIGIASSLLSGAVPAMLGLSASMALLGVAAAAVGIGIMALSAGLTTLAVSGVAGAAALVEVARILAVGLLNVIVESATEIGNAIKVIILLVCDVIIECVPTIVKTILVVVKEVLSSLADNAPEIVDSILKLIIGIIDAIGANMSSLVQSVVNLFMQFFVGITEALKSIDTSTLIEGIVSIGLITGLMAALSLMTSLAPSAMVGIIAMGLVLSELAIVLSAVGALSQIPGLKWLVGEGGDLLQGIGTAIGKLIGGIVGGFMSGVSSQFPQIGSDLSQFMTNVEPFLVGASSIDSKTIDGVSTLAKTILLLTAADILQGLTSWLTGGSSISSFGKELEEFGPMFSNFAEEIKNVDPDVVSGAANSAMALAEMASKLPNSGGLAAKILGDNTLSSFGEELDAFGPYISSFAETVKDVKPEAVQGAASAAGIMAELANTLPEEGSLKSTIFGGNTTDLDDFGKQLERFADYFVSFNESLALIDVLQLDNAIKELNSLIQMANDMSLVNTSGMVGFVEGLNQISYTSINSFIDAFANSQDDVILAIDTMAKYAIDELSIKKDTFKTEGTELKDSYLLGFSDLESEMYVIGQYAISGLVKGLNDNQNSVYLAAKEMASLVTKGSREVLKIHSPSEEGESDGKNFDLGTANGLDKYSNKVKEAAKNVAESVVGTTQETMDKGIDMNAIYSVYGGIQKSNFSKSATDLVNINKITSEKMQKINDKTIDNQKETVSTNKKLNTDSIREEKSYWAKLLEIKKAGVDGAKYQDMSLAEFEEDIFNQTVDIWKNYTDQLSSTAESVFNQTDPFDELSKKEAKSKDEIKQNLENQIKDYKEFAETLAVVSNRLGDSDFGDYVRNMSVDSLEQLKVLNSMTDDELTEYSNLYDTKMAYATNIASTQLYDLKQETEKQLEDLFGVMEGSILLDEFAQNFTGTMESLTGYLTEIVEPVSNELKAQLGVMDDEIQEEVKEDFYETGEQAGQGFANGLLSKITECAKAGADIAKRAYEAAKKELDEHSPSKKMGEVGNFAGLGFINSLAQYISKSEIIGRDLGKSSLNGISDVIKEMSTILDDGGIDLNPTITPVLDLGDVRSSASEINKMFNEAVKTTSMNVGTVGKLMNERKEATKEQKDVGDTGKTENNYTFNQYNTSPKALSEIDIYRQTKNQFSMLKDREVKQ